MRATAESSAPRHCPPGPGGTGAVIGVFLLLATLEAYWGVWRLDFVELDDADYVYDNDNLALGLTWRGLRWAVNTYSASNWHPLTWLSLLVDYQCFGAEPAGYHTVNLALHGLNAVLLFLVCRRLTGALWASAVLAAFFAVHPLHVESVAWVSERKDVLSTCFFLLALWAYAAYASRPGWGRYLGVAALYALSLLAKPMMVTLPCLLLLLDCWPLGRTPLAAPAAEPGGRPARWGWLLLEKVPLLALAAGDSVLTVLAQREAMSPLQLVPWGQRLANAVTAYAGYLGMMVWPSNLGVLYLHQGASLPAWKVALASVLLAGVTGLVFWFGRRRPYLIVGWLWYLGTLVPVIGILQVGQQRMADRYTYVPLIGVFLLAIWWFAERRRSAAPVLACVLLAACVVATRLQLRHWRDTDALWAQALRVEPENYVVHGHWAAWLRHHDHPQQALAHLAEAVRLQPHRADWNNDYAVDLWKEGRTDEALEHWQAAVKLDPALASAWNNLGCAHALRGRWEEAKEAYGRAAALQPCNPKYQRELADVYRHLGCPEQARRHARRGVQLERLQDRQTVPER